MAQMEVKLPLPWRIWPIPGFDDGDFLIVFSPLEIYYFGNPIGKFRRSFGGVVLEPLVVSNSHPNRWHPGNPGVGRNIGGTG